MTRKEAIANLNMISVAFVEPVTKEQRKLINDTFDMAIQALSQEPICDRDCEHCTWTECPIKPRELLVLKSNAFIQREALKKLLYDIEKGKEKGVIILPPYIEPLLVPNDIEIITEYLKGVE